MAVVFASLLTFLLALTCVFSQSDWADGGFKEIEAGTHKWGEWHEWEFCPNNTYVYGMQLRTEAKQGKGDDSALNAVRLFCAPLGTYQQSASIESYGGLWGEWGKVFPCNQSVMQGIDVREEPEQGSGDDSAMNNVRMICSNQQVIEGDGQTWGSWLGERKCPKDYAVCGIKVAFEKNQGNGDDTALNKVRLACCKVKQKTCVPKDSWVRLLICDNSWSDSQSVCTYKQEIGTSMSSNESATLRKEQQLQYSTTADVYGLKAIFSTNLGKSPTTGYHWTSSPSNTFGEVVSTDVQVTVSARSIKYIYQVVGTCGAATVKTPFFHFYEVNPGLPRTSTGNARTKSAVVPDSVGVPAITASKDDLSWSNATAAGIIAPADNTFTSKSVPA